MIPFGSDTVTLLHKAADGYTTHTLTGCSWRQTKSQILVDNALQLSMIVTCRAPVGQTKPDKGDLMILGEYNAAVSTSAELSRLYDALRRAGVDCFRVESVRDNSMGAPLPHYAATGA